jgi:hypothetical protein
MAWTRKEIIEGFRMELKKLRVEYEAKVEKNSRMM